MEDKVKQEIIMDIIIDMLFSALKKQGNKIEIENYNISEKNLTYLLRKYDEKRFNEYEKMLLEEKED